MGNLSPEKRRKYQLARYESRRLRFIEEMGGECVECGSREDLQFDHVNPETKEFSVSSRMVSAPLHVLRKELEKCQLLCEECHIEKTTKELTGRVPWNKGDDSPSHGTYQMAYPVNNCSCDECELFREKRRESRRTSNTRRPQTSELIHGTYAGYQKELRKDLETCDKCKAANRTYMQKFRT